MNQLSSIISMILVITWVFLRGWDRSVVTRIVALSKETVNYASILLYDISICMEDSFSEVYSENGKGRALGRERGSTI